MKQESFVLICINEDKEVVSVSMHSSEQNAQSKMEQEFEDELRDMDHVECSDISQCIAHIYYGDNLEYHWEIWKPVVID